MNIKKAMTLGTKLLDDNYELLKDRTCDIVNAEGIFCENLGEGRGMYHDNDDYDYIKSVYEQVCTNFISSSTK